MWNKAIPFVSFPLDERPLMNEKTTKHRVKEPEIRPEYDFSGGARGKYHKRYMESSNVVVIEPDVHRRFRNAAAVNKALRSIIRQEGVRRGPTKRSNRRRAKSARAGNR